jgi:hypothetical protein
LGNGLAGFDISRATHEDRLEGVGLLQIADDGGKGFGIPAFGGPVGGAWEDRKVGLRGCVYWFGESGGRGKFGFAFRQSEIFQKAEVLVGGVHVAVWGCSAGVMFGEEKVSQRARESRAIRDGESFESNAKGVGKECGRRSLLFFQDRVEGKGKRRCRNIFDFGD